MAGTLMEATDKGDGEQKQAKRSRPLNPLLSGYYENGISRPSVEDEDEIFDPFDIDRPHFNPDLYLNKQLKELSLTELIDRKDSICKQIVALDSDMKTLVYENYNKFISATDTIRKMKSDFCKMEDEMDRLATNMAAITDFSGRISSTLQDRRQQINKLSNTHSVLRKLQFLFELPAKLNNYIEAEAYGQVVRYYVQAQQALHQYQHMPSFQGIRQDCDAIIDQLKNKLRQQFHEEDATPNRLSESISLLLKLNEPAERLCEEFLLHASRKLQQDLAGLDLQIKLLAGEVEQPERPADAYLSVPLDILAFVDLGCNQFLSNICLVIAAYQDLFLNVSNPLVHGKSQSSEEAIETIVVKKLANFGINLMEQYFKYVEQRLSLEKNTEDNSMLVRALDRFHRRLQVMSNLLPDINYARIGTDIVSRAASERCGYYLQTLKQHFTECLTDVRQTLASSRPSGSPEDSLNLLSLLKDLLKSVEDQMKSVLSNLQAFLQSDITFAAKPYFREKFCKIDVRESVTVAFFSYLNDLAMEFCNTPVERGTVPPPLLLLLSKFCLEFGSNSVSYLLSLTEEQFPFDDLTGITTSSQLCADTRDVAQKLLNHYVRLQGLAISQMLRKSVDTRDWMNTIEPRTVRAVMKRVVEDVTAIDTQVGQLYEEGIRRERSSDSSRRAFSHSTARQNARSTWSSYAPSTLDDSLLSNIHKLFSERIEIFSPVEFSKVSVLTGIVKISLKTFLECVRLRTFGRYGLQQIQVDTHYLQIYLWRFVADENLVHVLLDEILSSAIYRCLEPTLMEPSVVEVICDRG